MRRKITMQPLGVMKNCVRPKRVSSSTAPAKPVPSSSCAYSEEDAAGWYAANGEGQMSGQDKHFVTMLDNYSEEEANVYLDSYH